MSTLISWLMASMDDSRARVPLAASSSTVLTVFNKDVTLVTITWETHSYTRACSLDSGYTVLMCQSPTPGVRQLWVVCKWQQLSNYMCMLITVILVILTEVTPGISECDIWQHLNVNHCYLSYFDRSDSRNVIFVSMTFNNIRIVIYQ